MRKEKPIFSSTVSVGNFNRLIWIFEGIKNNHRGNIFGARFTLKLHDLNRL